MTSINYSPSGGWGGGGSNPVAETPTVFGPSTGGGGGSSPVAAPVSNEGKFSIDLTNPLGTIAGLIGGVGDVANAVGSIGIPGGPNLGGIPKAIGDIGIPGGPHVADIPGAAGNIVGAGLNVLAAPGRFVETEFGAKYRLRAHQAGSDLAGSEDPLPPDIQARLDAGEDVNKLADELVARGAGYSSNPIANLAGEIALDPLNLIAPAASKVAGGIKDVGIMVKGAEAAGEADRLGLGSRMVGTAYNAAAHGLSAGGAAIIDKTIGPATAGILHVLGTAPLRQLRSGLSGISDGAVARLDDAMGRFNAQIHLNALTREIENELKLTIDGKPSRLAEATASATASKTPLDIAGQRLIGMTGRDMARASESYLRRFTPQFEGVAPDVLRADTAAKLAELAGINAADAERVVGKTVSLQMAQTVHGAYYAFKGHELATIIRDLPATAGLDAERLTLIAPDTLTVERADDLLKAMKAGDVEAFDAALGKYSQLGNRFNPATADWAKVREFIGKLKSEDALPTALSLPKMGTHKLPEALSKWRTASRAIGYDAGFAPKDLWRVERDELGRITNADPFVAFADELAPVTARNPLGRTMDAMFKGINQERIVIESRHLFTRAAQKAGIAPNEARKIHQVIIGTAADRRLSPRALATEHASIPEMANATVIDEAFHTVLGPERFKELVKTTDPVLLAVKSFRGNAGTVGLTQYATGSIKTAPVFGTGVIRLAEKIYPQVRFTLNPLFQAQELVESPILNALRGNFFQRPLDPLVKDALGELSALPEFKLMDTAGYVLNVASKEAVRRNMGGSSKFGQAVGRALDIAGRKDASKLTQIVNENGQAFVDALAKISPEALREWTARVGNDPNAIADAVLKERLQLADRNGAVKVFDAAKADLLATLDKNGAQIAGKEAASREANVAVGVANGGTRASGGAIKAAAPKFGADNETVWQAFRDSVKRSSEQAFKTHYFATERGFLERTVNHPYLGLYPASYMWGKILPEFVRFLVKRPFGLDAPLVGLAALSRTQQAFVATVAADPSFGDWLDKNKDALYLVNQLMPGNPTDLPANAPAWARHLLPDLASGKPVNFDTIGKQVEDSSNYAFGPGRGTDTIFKGANDVVGIAGDLFANLTHAAAAYDGQFPHASVPLPTRFVGTVHGGGGAPPAAGPAYVPNHDVFNPNAKLDASQVVDRRSEVWHPPASVLGG